MGWWFEVVLAWGCVAANLVMFWFSWRRYWAAYRLEGLLTQLATESFMRGHAGTFEAWAETMGDLQVQIRTRPKEFTVGTTRDEA